ncbi:MAG: hypothetical protein R3F65_09140 [bacterium]
MARYEEPYEERVARETFAELRPLVGDPNGPLRGIRELSFEAGPDHTGDPAIIFMVEFAASEPAPVLDRINAIERFVSEKAWSHATSEPLFVYFRYRQEGEPPLDDGDSEAPAEAQA